MKATIFKKHIKTARGLEFDKYVTNLITKGGDIVYTEVKFKRGNEPDTFPIIVDIDKGKASLTDRIKANRTYYTLWINEGGWHATGEEYRDSSLDAFD